MEKVEVYLDAQFLCSAECDLERGLLVVEECDQDLSALSGTFTLRLHNGRVVSIRVRQRIELIVDAYWVTILENHRKRNGATA